MSDQSAKRLKIRRALLTVSDKSALLELGRALHESGAELVATGKTAILLKEAGLPITPIEKVSGSPEAFQGRMKTLSFPVCSGILYRRGDASDEKDLSALKIQPIDCVVVNFYPFEAAAAKEGISEAELIEQVDIGGPTLVRAAAKNAPEVLVLTDPSQYGRVVEELRLHGSVSHVTSQSCAKAAWLRVLSYDQAIAEKLATGMRELRYGENPHQKAVLEFDPEGPIAWGESITPSELSYNNILDLSAAYALTSDLKAIDPASTGVVIVKHNNPCGVALVPVGEGSLRDAQMAALKKAWDGDPVSAFGGVLCFTDPLQEEVAVWLAEKFVELVAWPGLVKDNSSLLRMLSRRRNLKAVGIRRLGEMPTKISVSVPGGKLSQTPDTNNDEVFHSVTKIKWPKDGVRLSRFGVACCRSLKSNSLAIVREIPGMQGALQLVGAGQGQPNRVEALEKLAIPRAKTTLATELGESADSASVRAALGQCILVSDAFFPFRDTVDRAHEGGIRFIIQPGGSIKDSDSIAACDEFGISMAFTGIRHFRH